jgi:hypothetical protein
MNPLDPRAIMEQARKVAPFFQNPESLAQAFHEAYERLAPQFGYRTREASAKPWHEVPENNRRLMIAVCREILAFSAVSAPTSPSDQPLGTETPSPTAQPQESGTDPATSTTQDCSTAERT